MNIVKVGDTEKAICEECKALVGVTFMLRDVALSDHSGVVNKVMAGVCSHCDNVAVIPHQSTPAIRHQIRKQRKSVETRIPAHLIDMLDVACVELGGSADSVANVMKYYIHVLSIEAISPKHIRAFLRDDLAGGKAQKRLSLKGRNILEETEVLKKLTQIPSTTDLIKAVVLKIYDDILINKRKKPISDLKNIIAATA